MGPAALVLASATAKQTWFWEVTLAAAAVLLALNLLLFVAVFGRRFRELLRRRRSREFRRECEQLLDELDSGNRDLDPDLLRARIGRFDELERPVAATMLIERVRPASAEEREALLHALREVGATELLLRSTRRWAPWRRALAIRTLGLLGAEEAVPVLTERLSDRSRNVREAAVRALGRIGDPMALPALAELYARPGRVGAGIVYEALLALGAPSARVFSEGLLSPDEAIRVTSCFGIASLLEPEAARAALERMLDDPAAPVRAAACRTLGRVGGTQLPDGLAGASRDEERNVRREAVSALGSYDDPRALPSLRTALDDADRDVALRAGESLVRLGRLPRVGARAAAAIEETRAWAARDRARPRFAGSRVSDLLFDIWIVSLVIFFFFLVYGLVTLTLTGLSFVEEAQRKIERGDLFRPVLRPLRPGVSVIAAAYNEQPVIVPAVRSLLASEYEPLEVVIVDDGSADGTLETLVEAFDLTELPVGDRLAIETAPLERLYVSRADPRLRVARKRNGGRSDALNAGLNLARHELVATVDADSLLDRDALARIVEVFAADPDRVVAVGGTARIANGGLIEDGVLTHPRVPVSGTEASQVGEYLRAFLGARIAWARLNGLLIISGAFGVFRRDLFRAVGGLSRETLGEDMELVLRMHELRPARPGTRVEFAADATSWTEAPSGLRPLRGQRVRWHIGLLDNLRLHRRMIGRPRYGAAGVLTLPYTILFEVVAPILQVLGYAILIVLLVRHQVAWEYAVAVFVVVLLFGQLQTAGAILIEEIGFGRYRRRDLILIGGWGVLEIFWYRPLTALWRTWASVLWLAGRRPGWGTIPRGAALAEGPLEAEPAPLSR